MFKPIEVKALPDYRLYVRYDNAVEGGINSSKVPQTVNITNEVPDGEFIATIDV